MTLRLSSRIGIAALMLFAPLAAAPAQASLAPNSGILPVSAIPAQSQEPDPLTPSGPGVAICFAETTGDNTTDFSSADAQALRDALAAATPGGTVKLAGTCEGAIFEAGDTQVGVITQTMTLTGGYTPTNWLASYPITQPTVLDALFQGRVLSIITAATIAHLVVQNGSAMNAGGVYAASALTVTGGVFRQNGAFFGSGGGALVLGPASVTGAVFQGNFATNDGGGLFVSSTLALSGTQFLSNSALGFYGGGATTGGGGVFVLGSAVVTGAVFHSGYSASFGGGLLVGSTLELTGTRFLSNTAQIDGGGAFAAGTVVVTGSVFEANQALAGNGGALYVSSTLTLVDARFFSNTAVLGGGGAFVAGAVVVTGSVFEVNYGSVGGGLYGLSALVLTGTHFLSNTAVSVVLGGGGAFVAGAVVVTGSVFEANQALAGNGGALYVSSTLTLVDARFFSNTAILDGGGAFVASDGVTTSTLLRLSQAASGLLARRGAEVSKSLFQGNRAASGGGLAVNDRVAVTATQFVDNRASVSGGGFHHRFPGVNIRFVNSLFARNEAPLGAAAAFAEAANAGIDHVTIASPTLAAGSAIFVVSGTLNLTNTIIASHTIGISRAGGTVNENFNLFFGNALNRAGGILTGASSLFGDPRFANPWADDYHLGAGSAAINTGANAGLTADFDEDPRPLGGRYDIGYDESLTSPRAYLPLVAR